MTDEKMKAVLHDAHYAAIEAIENGGDYGSTFHNSLAASGYVIFPADQLAAKNAEIERLTRELSDTKLVAQHNLDWFNQLKPDFDTAIRQRDALKKALRVFAAPAAVIAEGFPDHDIVPFRLGQCRDAAEVLSSLDQPADAAKGEKHD